jgi:hypothetical protein
MSFSEFIKENGEGLGILGGILFWGIVLIVGYNI